MAFHFLVTIACAVTVSAHGYIAEIVANGQSYTGYNPTVEPWTPDQGTIAWGNTATDTGYVAPSALQSPDIVCHRDAWNANLTAEAVAGSNVTLYWTPWPDSHHGPIMNYLANCNGDCAKVNKTQLEFFKISELGEITLGSGDGTPGYWAADQLIDNNNTWVVTIPSSIAAGNYVLRHEILALHSAYAEGGAQFYPQCINLNITSSGQLQPDGVLATDMYTSTDPGVLYNIYNDETDPTYQIPGPPLFSS
jgi:hypothetical protein